MKQICLIFLLVPMVFHSFAWGHKKDATTENSPTITSKMTIKIGNQIFTATLSDNPTVVAFKQRLPLTVSMIDLNSNEKYYQFPDPLPANASKPGTIQNGDLMLFQDNYLVVFYKTFSTAYSYTRLGRIDNPAGLEAALGSGNVTVSFGME